MNEASGDRSPETSGQRRTLVMLMLLFLGPLIVSLVLYFGGYDWRPSGTVEKGFLFNPARPLPAIAMSTPEGESLGDGLMDGIWTVIQLNDGTCDEACTQSLISSRQVRLSLGRKMTRIQRVLVNRGTPGDLDSLRAQHPELIVASGDGLGDEWSSQFMIVEGLPWSHDRIFVVDPLGNLVMAYEPGFELRDLQEDLKRLLRLSRIG